MQLKWDAYAHAIVAAISLPHAPSARTSAEIKPRAGVQPSVQRPIGDETTRGSVGAWLRSLRVNERHRGSRAANVSALAPVASCVVNKEKNGGMKVGQLNR